MEEPCYDGARVVFQSNGFKILPVPVREDGIDLQKLFVTIDSNGLSLSLTPVPDRRGYAYS